MTDADTGRALLAAVLAAPDDDTPRLVYADWLTEQGDGERAEFVRVQCELARTLAGGGPGCNCAGVRDPNHVCRQTVWIDRAEELRRRERELWPAALFSILDVLRPAVPDFAAVVYKEDERPSFTPRKPELYVRRGFIESATCSAADWLSHADAILCEHPVRDVTLTTIPLLEGNDDDVGLLGDQTGRRFAWADARKEADRLGLALTDSGVLPLCVCSLRWRGVRFVLPTGGFVVPPELVPLLEQANWQVEGNILNAPAIT